MAVAGRSSGTRTAFPYLADVQWPEPERIVLTVQSRDQRRLQVLAAEVGDGVGDGETIGTSVLFEDSDDTWVELVHGAPAVFDDGRVVMTAEHEGARRLVAASVPLTPAGAAGALDRRSRRPLVAVHRQPG